MKIPRRYLIIDDDPMTLYLCSIIIGKTIENAMITTFEKPEEALSYIQANYPLPTQEKTVMLLDINMPVLSGWDFIQEMLEISPSVMDQFNIYIQSSSVDNRDIEKAAADPNIIDFISKPLKKDTLVTITSVSTKAE